MGFYSFLRGWVNMLFKSQAKTLFDVKDATSEQVEQAIVKCAEIYRGNPYWIDLKENIKTVNFAKSICSETARLTTLAIKVSFDESARGKWLQEQVDKMYYNMRDWVEYGTAFGTVVLKPNGDDVTLFTPNNFLVTDYSNGKITGCIFFTQERAENGKTFYNRLEWHRFKDNEYVITNHCFKSDSKEDIGKPVSIDETPWKGLEEESYIADIEKPLFGVFRTPMANNIDISSPMGMPIITECIEELKDLDVAYSRNALEIMDSERTVLVDDSLLTQVGKNKQDIKMPRFARKVFGDSGAGNFYQEINPTLNTATRIQGINAILSQIGYKVGFANGYFVFNEKNGIQTATGVEAEQQRTIQFVKDMRDKLEDALNGVIYALDVFADLYDLAPSGEYEVNYDFGDITYNYEEDRQRWWSYVVSGTVPKWMYFTKFEGMTEDEAKAMEEEMQPKEDDLYSKLMQGENEE